MTDIIKTSASAIESFDDSSPFGCQRRWFFKSVLKVPEPPRDNLTLGTNLHTAIENFLIKGAPGEMKPEVQRLFHAIKPEVIRVRDEGFLALEHPIDFLMAPDVRIVGRIDVLRKNGPLDWKTSSNVAQYAPTPYKLARSTQMLTYSWWQEKVTFDGNTIGAPTQVTHVYVQTKGTPVTQRIDAVMTPTLLTEGISRVINIAREMKAAQSLPHSPEGANDLRPDRSKCRANTKMPCPYLNICPVEKAAMSSALDRLKARLNTAPMPPAQKAVVDAVKAAATAIQNIVPPDAPAPALVEKFMAVPPPNKPPIKKVLTIQEPAPGTMVDDEGKPLTFADMADMAAAKEPTQEVLPSASNSSSAPVAESQHAPAAAPSDETPKRGRGRPPGAKNKPKDVNVVTPDEHAAALSEARENVVRSPATDGVITFKSITVTMTGKLNMGHFQSMDICVSQTAEYTTSPEEAFLQVTNVVKKQLDSALETIAGRTVKAPVPADVLNSTKR